MPRHAHLVWLFAPIHRFTRGGATAEGQSHGAWHSGKYWSAPSVANILHLTSCGLPSGEEPEERVLRPGSVTSQLHADLKIHDNVGWRGHVAGARDSTGWCKSSHGKYERHQEVAQASGPRVSTSVCPRWC